MFILLIGSSGKAEKASESYVRAVGVEAWRRLPRFIEVLALTSKHESKLAHTNQDSRAMGENTRFVMPRRRSRGLRLHPFGFIDPRFLEQLAQEAPDVVAYSRPCGISCLPDVGVL